MTELSRRAFVKWSGVAVGVGVAGAVLPPGLAAGATVPSTSAATRAITPAAGTATGTQGAGSRTPLYATGTATEFVSPAAIARPMSRLWFADAQAGATTAGLALVDKYVRDLHAAGFGGSELAFLSDNTRYSNDDAATIGFGSENWRRIVKQVFRTANALGHRIDLTLSDHWPVAFNNLDPNDDAQQQELSYATTKLTADAVAGGRVELELPTPRTKDGSVGGFSFPGAPDLTAPFLFVDTLVAATVVTVTGFDAKNAPVFAVDSMIDISEAVQRFGGQAAGIPDRAYAAAHGLDYQSILASWGPEAPAGTRGKIAPDGSRRRMADHQYQYRADVSRLGQLKNYRPSAGSALAVGDKLIFGTFRRGTGQFLSGGASIPQHNRHYVTTLYDTVGVDKAVEFWAENILDKETVALVRANSAKNRNNAFFEDSLELTHSGPFWGLRVLETISTIAGYKAATYAPVFALGTASSFDDPAKAGLLLEDYVKGMGQKYRAEHVAAYGRWAKTLGYVFKAQPEAGAPGVSGAEPGLGINEGDNSTGPDGFRNLAGAANLSGTNLVSDETLTFVAEDYGKTWLPLAVALNKEWAYGMNRGNFHGSPYPKQFNDFNDAWPGWDYQLLGTGLGAFDARQIYWGDQHQFSDFVARTQAVLQSGTAKVDLALLEGAAERYEWPKTTRLPALLNHGWSYNIIDEGMLELPAATVGHGVLAESGPAYKAIVVADATTFSVSTIRRLNDYAAKGLPIILLNSNIQRVFGTPTAANSNSALQAEVARLSRRSNVHQVTTEEEALQALVTARLHPAASHSIANVTSWHRKSAVGDYYYFCSIGTSLTSAVAAGATSISVASTVGLAPGDQLLLDIADRSEVVTVASVTQVDSGPNVALAAPLRFAHDGPSAGGTFGIGATPGAGVSSAYRRPVTLQGAGVPYQLDPWTGRVTPISAYTQADGLTTVELTLGSPSAALFLMAPKTSGIPAVHALTVPSGSTRYLSDGSLVHIADSPTNTRIRLSNGKYEDVKVGSLPVIPALNSGWDLTLESWGPDPGQDLTDPSASTKTTIRFTKIDLKPWAQLPASSAQLTALGVDSMSKVAGRGSYRQSFTLPSTIGSSFGGVLQISHLNDIIASITINGVTLDTVDPFTDAVDLHDHVRPGMNTVEINIDTTLQSRVPGKANQPYGLTSLHLNLYRTTVLAK